MSGPLSEEEVTRHDRCRWDYGSPTTRRLSPVREALGQILDYNHYPEREATKMRFLVLDEAPSSDDCAFVAALRAERKFPIYLGWKYG
jgi:hypothetical protein